MSEYTTMRIKKTDMTRLMEIGKELHKDEKFIVGDVLTIVLDYRDAMKKSVMHVGEAVEVFDEQRAQDRH
jgi:hypothetical protein